MELEWITPLQAADRWGVSARRVQALCVNGQIDGVKKLGRVWLIPQNTAKPIDGRKSNGRIAEKKESHTGNRNFAHNMEHL